MTPLMSVTGLSAKRKRRRGLMRRPDTFNLSDINFELQAGETMAIVGDNGSGKSLLARLLVGAERADKGAILLKGEDIMSQTAGQRSQSVRMIFQHSRESLNPNLTLGNILDEPLKLNTTLNAKERTQQIEKTLTQVGLLREHQHFYRHMLSDGQRQRVAIARALILRPQVVVADEPFAALDPSVRSQTINLLLDLQRDLGLGFIFISHNLGIVRHISDRILVLQDGRVIESGKTDVVFHWPKSEYTQRLIQSHQILTRGTPVKA